MVEEYECMLYYNSYYKGLVINYGGGEAYKTGGGGACEVLPLQKGGEEVSAMLKGGGTTSFGIVFMLEVLAIL